MKKLLTLFVFLFIPLIAILFVQCNEPVIEPTDQDMAYKPNDHGNGVGGGGGTELTNNLSLPGFYADGYALPALDLTNYPNPPYWTIPYVLDGVTYYAQKVEGNIWRAYNATWTAGDVVTYIDWGDNIESVNPKLKIPYRLEISLYKQCTAPMTGYTMTLLANPSDPDEMQGTNADAEYEDGLYASIASGKAKLVIQKWANEDTEPTDWLGSYWAGATTEAENLRFAVELNVAGKLNIWFCRRRLGTHRNR